MNINATYEIKLGGVALLLTILFALLDAFGVLDWPWWAILLPVFIVFGGALTFIVIGLLVILLAFCYDVVKDVFSSF